MRFSEFHVESLRDVVTCDDHFVFVSKQEITVAVRSKCSLKKIASLSSSYYTKNLPWYHSNDEFCNAGFYYSPNAKCYVILVQSIRQNWWIWHLIDRALLLQESGGPDTINTTEEHSDIQQYHFALSINEKGEPTAFVNGKTYKLVEE